MKALIPGFEFVYGDAEFTPNNHGDSGLVSLALHSVLGSVYMVNKDVDRESFCANAFCRDNIWSKLPLRPDGSLNNLSPNVMSYTGIREMTSNFFREMTGGQNYRNSIGFVADHGTQDMQRIHNLFRNDWGSMPPWIPKRPFADLASLEDLAGVREARLPDGTPLPDKDPELAHHAMYDAQWDREVHNFLLEHSAAVRIASGTELAPS